MKKIVPLDPMLLCKNVVSQANVGKIELSGQENKPSCIKEIVALSATAAARGLSVGDIILTRQMRYLEVNGHLTEDDSVPYSSKDKFEIIDPSQIIALYKEEEQK